MPRHNQPARLAHLALSLLCRAGCCLLLSVAASSCPGQITASSREAAIAVLHRNYIASGGERWKAFAQLEVDGTLNLGGIAGTYKQVTDLRRGRDVDRLDAGPVHMTQATLPDASWQLDQSGVVSYADTPDAKADAVNASFIDRNGWFDVRPDQVQGVSARAEAGRQYEVVSIVPAGGRKMKLWFRADDGLLDRIDQLDAAHHPSSIRLSDYRQVDGVLMPFVQRQFSASQDPDVTETIRSARFSAQVDETRFEPPPSSIRDASLEGGRTPAEVPFRLADNRVLVEVAINGHAPLPFLLDSGASNILTPEAARGLGLETSGDLPVAGVGKDAGSAHVATVKTVRLGRVALANQPFLILSLPNFLQDRGGEPPIAGLLGAELLRRFPTTFDYQRKMLTFSKPGSTPPVPPHAQRERLFMNGGHSYLQVQVDGATGVFGIDTGDSGSVTLFSAFLKQHSFPVEQPTQAKPQGGLGGTQTAQLTRVDSVSLGNSLIKRPLVTLSTGPEGVFSNGELAGNMGYQFLRRFVFTLDYEHRVGYFSEASGYASADPYNRSGLSLDRNAAGAVYASYVNPGTPAQRAGIHVGDQIVAIDGESATTTARSRLSNLLSGNAGTPVTVAVLRDGKEQAISFNLAELLPVDGPLIPLVEKLSALPTDVGSISGTWACKETSEAVHRTNRPTQCRPS